MSNKLQHTHVYFCNGSKRGKLPQRKGKADDFMLKSLSMFFYTQIYYIETPTSHGTVCDPSDARFQHMLIVFIFYLDKNNIRDLAYRQEILRCVIRHQHIIIVNNTLAKAESILPKFRRATSWEKDQLRTLFAQSIEVNKNCYEEAIFNLIREIKTLRVKWEETQQPTCRKASILTRKCSSASKLFDCVQQEEIPQVRQKYSQRGNGKGNPISFFRKISRRRQEDKNDKSPFWGVKRYQQGETNKNFLFGHFSGTLKRKNKKQNYQDESALKDSLSKTRDYSCNSAQNLSTAIMAGDDVFEIRGTEVNLEKRITKRPWINWKSKATPKVQKSQSATGTMKLPVPNVNSPLLKSSTKVKAFVGIPSSPKSAPSSPASGSDVASSDADATLGKSDSTSDHEIIRVGAFSRSDSCQSLPHITVTHSGAPGSLDSSGSFLNEVDFLPRVSCLEDFEHFSKYAIFRPERSRRRSSQRFLIIRYPDDLSLLQKRDSSSELVSSVCSSPNPYDALELTAGYESESPLQSPETRRSIYPQPVPAFPVESCFPPIEIPKNVPGT